MRNLVFLLSVFFLFNSPESHAGGSGQIKNAKEVAGGLLASIPHFLNHSDKVNKLNEAQKRTAEKAEKERWNALTPTERAQERYRNTKAWVQRPREQQSSIRRMAADSVRLMTQSPEHVLALAGGAVLGAVTSMPFELGIILGALPSLYTAKKWNVTFSTPNYERSNQFPHSAQLAKKHPVPLRGGTDTIKNSGKNWIRHAEDRADSNAKRIKYREENRRLFGKGTRRSPKTQAKTRTATR